MARQILINHRDDMEWLHDVHLPRLSPKYKSAVIHGNEDYPDQIDVYEARDPHVTDKPIVYVADDHGVFRKSAHRRWGT